MQFVYSPRYEHDQLGNLRLTKEGLLERDRFVFSCARERRVPIAVTLGGGYAFDTDDTVALHRNTCLAAWKPTCGHPGTPSGSASRFPLR